MEVQIRSDRKDKDGKREGTLGGERGENRKNIEGGNKLSVVGYTLHKSERGKTVTVVINKKVNIL